MHSLARILVCAVLVSVVSAGEAVATGPTQEEAAVLDMLNLLRTDKRRGEAVILDAIREKQVAIKEASWTKGCEAQNRDPHARPVVISPELCAAARALLAAGAKGDGKGVFDAAPAAKTAGYAAADKGATGLFAAEAPDLRAAFAQSCAVIVGEKPAGKSTNMVYSGYVGLRPAWREVGIAVSAAKGGKVGLAIVLGQGVAPRLLGGIAYRDANRNGVFEVGEGRPGVAVEVGKTRVVTGPGGVWWMAAEAGADLTVAFTSEGVTATRTVAKDVTIDHLPWRLPDAAELKTVDKLIADAEKAAALPDEEKRAGPLTALLIGARMASLDDTRAARVAKLTEPVVFRYDSLREKVLASLAEAPAEANKVIAAQRKAWNGALAGWFKEAATLPGLKDQLSAVLKAPVAAAAGPAKPLLAQLEKAAATTQEPGFMDLYLAWQAQIREHLDDEEPEPTRRR